MSLVLVDRNVRPHVSVVTLNKPERLNSMSFPLVEALYARMVSRKRYGTAAPEEMLRMFRQLLYTSAVLVILSGPGQALPAERMTLAERLHAAGYRTAAVVSSSREERSSIKGLCGDF